MKIFKNTIFTMLIAFTVFAFTSPPEVNAQNEWVKTLWKGGISYQYKMTGIDSGTTRYTGLLDWSDIDGEEVKFAYRYAATNDTIANDSIRIRMFGRFGETVDGLTASSDSLAQLIDTTVAVAIGSATPSQVILTNFLAAPYIYFEITEISGAEFYNDNNSNASLFLALYSRKMDYIPDKKNYVEDYPVRSR